MTYSRCDILRQLDQSAEQFRFPGFNNVNYHLGTARLNGFRNSHQWAILIEEICWWPASGGIVQNLSAFGNSLREKDLAFPGQSAWLPGMIYWPHSSIQCSFDDCGELSYSKLQIRGQTLDLDPREVAEQPEVPERGFAIMVHLIESFREKLLCTPEELRLVVPSELELLVKLDQWLHPDVYLGELPSQNESFVNLAEVLVSGDVSCLRPSTRPNVDWRVWMSR